MRTEAINGDIENNICKKSSFDAWQSCYPDELLNLNREIREDVWFEDMRSKLHIG